MTLICTGDWTSPGCGNVLTDEERYYYGTACEKCVIEGMDRVRAWRKGGDDPELDAMFDGPMPAKSN